MKIILNIFIFVIIKAFSISVKRSSITYGSKHQRIDQVKFFKGCLPQNLLGPFLNTLSHLFFLVNRLINIMRSGFNIFIWNGWTIYHLFLNNLIIYCLSGVICILINTRGYFRYPQKSSFNSILHHRGFTDR